MSRGFLARGRFTADKFERSLSTTTKVVVGIQWATTTTVVVGIERVTTTTVVVGIKWVKRDAPIYFDSFRNRTLLHLDGIITREYYIVTRTVMC